jgi:hypothetical protein
MTDYGSVQLLFAATCDTCLHLQRMHSMITRQGSLAWLGGEPRARLRWLSVSMCLCVSLLPGHAPLLVVGAGAAGLTAAYFAAKQGAQVHWPQLDTLFSLF